ncbi:patatin-like phospholipase [Marseillevirus marseillevirus]|uniref:Patatin-like phospholipase n=1 Tax=Marseillevirus marseillevirus TaxID=694581 RepID=D2XAM9_GBMV|nr:patatin-like phospholipase [Marseillevirus marseillevirus]ADB04006.1 patatin-like phospholipase [Marseillevirus marseillevirus]
MSELRNRRKRKEQKKEHLDALCLSGGGINGIATLGALEYFFRIFEMENISKFCGTSIGAIISLLVLCGYRPREILERLLCEGDICLPLSKLSFFTNYGLNDSSPLEKKLGELLEQKYGFVPTLSELFSLTKKEFVCVSANLSAMRIEYFSRTTKPNMSCVEAVLLSCNAPGVFKKREYLGSTYTDGGIFDNYPLSIFDDGETKILGINIASSNFSGEVGNFFDYMHRLMSFAAVQNSEKTYSPLVMNVRLRVEEFAFNLFVPDERKIELFGIGHLEASKAFRELSELKETLEMH